MPIQPLSQVKSTASLHFYPPDIMTVRPTLAVFIAECIAEWAQIESILGVILAVILETEAQTGLAMYMSLTSLSNQMTVVSAAAKAKLTVADEELFSAVGFPPLLPLLSGSRPTGVTSATIAVAAAILLKISWAISGEPFNPFV
jgi:hypothetical protein